MANHNFGYITPPIGDLSTSSTSHQAMGVPEGDFLTMSYQTIEQNTNFSEAGMGHSNHASPFINSNEFNPNDEMDIALEPGATVERPAIIAERPLHDLHINIVASQASKALIHGMMVNAGLNNMEQIEVKQLGDRRHACTELLKIWKRKDNTVKQVNDLIDLVLSVDGNNELFQRIARHVLESPP